MKNLQTFTILLLSILLLGSCADVQTQIEPCLNGHTYGFWGGLWHGIIAPFALVGSFFNDEIAVWAVNNNGGWYTFGFVLGVGGLSTGTSHATTRK